jgi:murein DD-endopeptidase MepM/ murein hydrolase activator NlpD
LFKALGQDPGRTESYAGDVAALSLTHALAPAGPIPLPAEEQLSWLDRLRHWSMDVDWTPDLGTDIGSRRWWRGFATVALLCTAAGTAWPGIAPIDAHAAPLRADDWDAARAQTIAPMAWGSDTGVRMAATDVVRPLANTPERPRIELTATLGQGDSFARLLERSGVGGGEAQRLASMVATAIPLGNIADGTRMDIVLGRRSVRTDPRPLESLAFRAALDLRLEVTRNNGALSLERIPIAVDDTPLRIRGRVGDSLYQSARNAGAPMSAVQSYLRIIAGQVSVSRDVNAGDEFDIIIAHRRAETGEVEVGELLYAGLSRDGRPRLRMLPWTVDGREQWFEASGVGQTRAGLARPTTGRITSGYGSRRHPVLGYRRMHSGIDFGAPYGSPIYAVADGTVQTAGYNGGFGRYVRLQHEGGLGSGYGHMSRIAVSSGQRVRRGQVIGYVGSTGLSTGPHLHYELYRGGRPINPMSVQFVQRAQLSGEQLARFRARLNQLTGVPVGGNAAARSERTTPRSERATPPNGTVGPRASR